jgi:hypothetical protein
MNSLQTTNNAYITDGKAQIRRLDATEVPESLRVLSINIRSESKLLALKGKQGLDKSEVFDSYGHDVNLLNDRMSDLETCVQHAIR